MKHAKICLVGNSLSSGGADRIHAVLSVFFVSQGLDVHNVIFIDQVTYSYGGTLLNMGARKQSGGALDLLRRFGFLRRYFREQQFDFIIDFRNKHKPWQEWLFTRMLYRTPYVITVHSYRTDWYIPGAPSLSRSLYRDAYGIVCVSAKIEAKVRSEYGYERVRTLYNPIELDRIDALLHEPITVDGRFVIGVGRMVHDNNKQFDGMIRAYAASALPEKNIRLVLLGDGPQRDDLIALVQSLGLSDKVVFPGFVDNPYAFLSRAECTLLTSRNEGLPNILVESLACGTPVVSFDCPSGPSEIVEDGVNGRLVPDQDFAKFTEALNEMVENSTLQDNCRQNARPSVTRFDIRIIGPQWLEYLAL
ncbi:MULTISPECIES: glycosyltransferase [unclassified Flavobacterium]|uniref:glycosyltransferase n=1 Tax=unclassified Flavobacterium TaxID=196869 RepID=UPI001F1339B9|nr:MULTISPECIES: glycosyltransferase [unclassified Flavobacterium]UMY65534.1 glycosyltransferase [Flavobacterium sp. HJ-32-4]